ncbi:MAG: rhodanese-like domain-containing protein [Saprospiraceae bacterium]|jgi:rhodanese-related sulfurtransferase|nr:rhodanese-like domain-containing protein [Saprospiraceae bacterium]
MANKAEQCPVSRWQLLKGLLNNLSPEAFRQVIATQPGITVIDVRTAEEFAANHIDGAINIDYLALDFLDCIEKLDPQRTYLVYCRSGRRSVRAATLMRNGGFKAVYHLDGGYANWDGEIPLSS